MIHDPTWTLLLLVYASFVACAWIIRSLVVDYFACSHPVQAWVLDARLLSYAERIYVGIVLWNSHAKTWPTPVPQAFPAESYGNRVRD